MSIPQLSPKSLPFGHRYVGKHTRTSALSLKAKAPLAVTAIAAASVASALPANAASLPAHPVSPRNPAANIDPLSDYIGQNSCDPVAQPGTKATLQLLLSHYGRGRSLGIVRNCAVGSQSEHKEGRAFDWGLNAYNPADKAAGDSFAAWVSSGEGARQLGVMYLIWNKRIWSAYKADQGWRAYTGASPHTDHIHLSMSWAGAAQRTSFWTGKSSTQDYGPCQAYKGQPAPVRTGWNSRPCPIPLPAPVQVSKRTYWVGQSGADVKVAQQKLGISADGAFGSGTRTAIMRFQRLQGLQVTGALDAMTWAKLVPASVTKYVVVNPLPSLPPVAPVVEKPVVSAPAPTQKPTITNPPAGKAILPDYANTIMRLGSQGVAVRRLQQVLGMPSRYQTGYFSTLTRGQVAKFQKHVGLTADGVVGKQTWKALVEREAASVRRQVVQSALNSVRVASKVQLKRGSTGTAVRLVQQALRVKVDGRYGYDTQLAVWRFQRAAGLRRTGEVDRATWLRIEQLVAKQVAAQFVR